MKKNTIKLKQYAGIKVKNGKTEAMLNDLVFLIKN